MRFGVHTSISGGIDKAVVRAAELGCETIQIFSSNPRGWKTRELEEAEIDRFKANLEQYKIKPVVIHAPYLLNLASPKEDLYLKSIEALKEQIKRGNKIGAQYLVLHPGSHTGLGLEKGIEKIIKGLNQVLTEVTPKFELLLENVAGAGTAIGATIGQLETIYNNIEDNSQVGICFDTCHGFSAGYDLVDKKEVEQLLLEIDDSFGLNKLGVIHANDCKGELGSNKDRHQHIGQGEIGAKGFKNLVQHPQLQDKAFILETPIDDDGNDESNLKAIRKLAND
ncbi:MAG: deoxyribonuclease IV [Bacillota bacterium]